MTTPLGVAIIGCGDVALSRHLPALAASDDARLVACCDREPDRAERASELGGGYATTDVDTVLGDPGVDAVIVATPPWVTPHMTARALRAGKDVLAEKPLALTLEEALSVQRAERESGQLVQVGFVMRHGPIFGTLRTWIAEGRLGTPLDFRISVFDETWDPERNPEHYERIMATLDHGAPVIHDGAHTMDHLRFLLDGDLPVRASAWGRKTRPEFPRPNLNGAVIEFSGGHRARVEIGWFLPRFPPSEWTIIGPDGMAWFDLATQQAHLDCASGIETVLSPGDWFVSCFEHQLAAFVNAVRTRQSPRPGTADGIASLALTQLLERGMETPLRSLEIANA